MHSFLYVFQSLLETIGVVALCFALMRMPLAWKKIIPAGIVVGGCILLIRMLPLTPGFHLPVGILLIFLYLVKFNRVKSTSAIIAVFASIFVLALLEFTLAHIYFALAGDTVITQNITWTMVGILQSVLMVIIALAVSRFRKPIQEG